MSLFFGAGVLAGRPELFILLGLALANGLIAGVFLTFSDFVMRGLAHAKPDAGVEVMQFINRDVYRSIFMVLFMGLGVVSLGLAVAALMDMFGSASPLVMVGSLLYLFGVFGVTARFNVPMNTRLDRLSPAEQTTHAYWQTYVQRWTRWNHVRSLAAALASVSFILSLLQLVAA